MQKKKYENIKGIITLFFVSLIFFSCNSKDFVREMKPLERVDVETKKNKGLIRSLFCNVSAQELKSHHFEKIMKIKYFRHRSKNMTYRKPPVEMFFCVIKNTWKFPVTLQSVDLSFNKSTYKRLLPKKSSLRYRSPLYSSINFKNLLHPHRVLEDKYNISGFIEKMDVIRYNFDFISPGDSEAYIFLFPKLSISVRKFHLNIYLKSLNRKKKIDFEFTPLEYRSKGNDFIKKEIKGLQE
jgi:hypothetical protein